LVRETVSQFLFSGETFANIKGIMQGHQDGELTESGKLQAKVLIFQE
jgi:broad specificity phosphatase PhoE